MKRYLLTLTAIALALGSAQAKKYADIKGRVTDTAGKPIAGAVVSNGIDCTATAADGTYSSTAHATCAMCSFPLLRDGSPR